MAKEQALAKQKEALKGKVSSVTKPKPKPPAPKKPLTLELDGDKKEQDDDFDRDSSPMTKDELEKESSNSVSSLQKLSEVDDLDNEKDTMQKTLSSSQLQDMFKEAGLEESKDETPTKDSDEAKTSDQKVTFVDDEEDDEDKDKKIPPPEDDVDEREEESDEEEPPMKSEDPYSNDLGSTLQGGKPDFGNKFKEFDDLDDDEEDERDE